MSFSFLNPWWLFPSAALLAPSLWLLARRRYAPALFVLGAACFALLAAEPAVGGQGGQTRHVLILDVSGSMEARRDALLEQSRAALARQWPIGHSLERRQVSDALRPADSPWGGPTRYGALLALGQDLGINGQALLVTDGRGRLEDLLSAVDPSRLVLLRAPQGPPDAAVRSVRGPFALPQGGMGTLRVQVGADRDVEATWRVFEGEREAASGRLNLAANVAHEVSHSFVAREAGLFRLRFTLEAAQDREGRNNVATHFVAVGGKRSILFCRDARMSEGGDALLALLRADERNDVRVVSRLPGAAGELAGVDAVIIHDLALAQSGQSKEGLQPLADWVRSGGRLMMAGARAAFGPGGYRKTVLEEVMPVKFRPQNDKPRQVVLLLDCSDSMRAAVGSQTRLHLLKQAALRVLDNLDNGDSAAVVGFSETADTLAMVPLSRRTELDERIRRLEARTTTRIGSALAGVLASLPRGVESRVMLVTDGEEGESRSQASWRELGAAFSAAGCALDIVLTENVTRNWEVWLRAAGATGSTASVGSGGFGEILEALDRALVSGEQGLLDDGSSHGGFVAGGIALPLNLVCRTSPRQDLGPGDLLLEVKAAEGDGPTWPLVARREMAGRSVALCTEGAGPAWIEGGLLVQSVSQALGFLLAGAGEGKLDLVSREDRLELVWVSAETPPDCDLRLSTGETARLLFSGRWELAVVPAAREVSVFAGERLVQRMALPQLPERELAFTGDDEAFFAAAESRGVTVLRSVENFQPRAAPEQGTLVALGWLAALAGIAALLAGFALRRR